jgi:replication factor A1
MNLVTKSRSQCGESKQRCLNTLIIQFLDSRVTFGFYLGAKVSDYGGKTLSTGFDSSMNVNPDSPETHRLKGWWEQKGKDMSFASHSGGEMAGGGQSDNFKTIGDVTDEQLGMGDKVRYFSLTKPDYFNLIATVSYIKQDGCWYPACGTEGCNKKVTQMDNGWKCEKCDKTFPNPNYRLYSILL